MREPRPEKTPRWVFDKLPPSGARRGGDPSEYAFNRTLDTFVREALQNANDQSLSRVDGRAEVCFDLEELAGRELRDFRMALGWDELHRHLRGAAAIKSISKFRPFAEGSPVQDRLILMRVEDRHTSGLVGEESEGDSNFRALCRDSLFSHKETAAAGGSYGLGKSVYWSFSSHSTVIFHSCLHERGGPGRHRLIGRVELPSHTIDGKHYMGPGWFGEPQNVENGERAVSLWDGQALDLARRLRIDRPPKVTGTTILVVGFRDPTSEGSDELPALLDRIRRSAAEFFWPAMQFPRPLRVLVGGQQVNVTDAVTPFVAAWQQRSRAGARLERPGDIAFRRIHLHLPRRRADKDGPDQLAECDLIVRLAEPSKQAHNPETLDNRVAVFRGPGMVVKYLPVDPSGLMPRFHAILACGEGRAPEHPTASDKYAEAFLRASEPPGHDDWSLSPRLKDDYVKGGGAKLNQLFDDVRKALRELLLAPTSEAQRGPELLQRRYPLGGVGDPKPISSAGAFHFSGLEATFSDGRWHFAGTVESATRGHAWTVTITLKMLGDDGSELDKLKIAEISLNSGSRGKAERTAEGTAVLSASHNIDGLAFSGVSEPLPDREQLCELGLELAGELLARGRA